MKFRIMIVDDEARDESFAFFKVRCERELEDRGHQLSFDTLTDWQEEVLDPASGGLRNEFLEVLNQSDLLLLDLSFPGWYDEPSFGVHLLSQLEALHQGNAKSESPIQIPPVVILSGAIDTEEELGDLPETSVLVDIFSKKRVLNKALDTFASRWEFRRLMLILAQMELKDQSETIDRQDRQLRKQDKKIKELQGEYTLIDGSTIDENLELYAKSELPVLITGPTGSGKEVLSRALHEKSPRKKKSFVPVNCGAVPTELFESLFFGIRKGAANGVTVDQPGYIQKADGGTLFLDEIGDLLPIHQVKLLRVLQDQTFFWVGDNSETQVDFRLICATNKDLYQCISNGDFRSDLYYRIHRIHVDIPPFHLRPDEAKKQILEKILKKYRDKYNKRDLNYSQQLYEKLMNKPTEGNLRVIDGMVETAVALFPGKKGEIGSEHLPKGLQREAGGSGQGVDYSHLFTDENIWSHPIWSTRVFAHEKKSKAEGSIGTLRIKTFDAFKRLALFLELKKEGQTVAEFATQMDLTSQTLTNPLDQYLIRLVHILPETQSSLITELETNLKEFLGPRSYQSRAKTVLKTLESLGG
jgi:transcriptional regulator with PAS, ATPase and Fis domain